MRAPNLALGGDVSFPLRIDRLILTEFNLIGSTPNPKPLLVVKGCLEASEFYRARFADRFRGFLLSSALAIKINASILARSIFRPITWNRQRLPLPEVHGLRQWLLQGFQ